MKVIDYIKKYKDEICYIQCFVNRLGIYAIADKTTQSLLTAKDGPISTFMENFNLHLAEHRRRHVFPRA